MTLQALYQSCSEALIAHGPTVAMLVTATIALCTRYTGWSPKLLGAYWEKVPALALSILTYGWILCETGVTLLAVSTAIVCGLIAGAGSNGVHDLTQAAAKSSVVGKSVVALLLLGALGVTTSCAALMPSPETSDLAELCLQVAPLDPEMQKVLATIPAEDRDAVLHAACEMAAKELTK